MTRSTARRSTGQRPVVGYLSLQGSVLGVLFDQPPAEVKVRLRIGAAEAVDRLLRVADDDGLPLHQRAGAVAGQALDDSRLRAVGVLELIDEDEVVLRPRALQHRLVIEEGQRAEEEVVEI